ncbi:MAG: hypothetical protein JWQ30_2000 [Sediminibacterium sp.]|nr:hypothetical protein [Sediminibacterium sp.]
MKIALRHFSLMIAISAICSCQSIKQSSKYGLTEGYYTGYAKGQPKMPIYVFPDEDSIKVYRSENIMARVDSGRSLYRAFPAGITSPGENNYYFKQQTLDFDVLSILLKYRPAIAGFPNQLNTSILNGALFLGYRTDRYKLSYQRTAFNLHKRTVNHYGFSYGVFTGLGASRIDPFVTKGALNIEYDGVVNPSGVAAIIGVDKLTFGLTLGIDHLLDKNHAVWIYQGKPWIGLSVGLNLN